MPLRAEDAAPMVSYRASFHRHDASRQLRHQLNELGPRQLTTEDNPAVARRRMQLERLFLRGRRRHAKERLNSTLGGRGE